MKKIDFSIRALNWSAYKNKLYYSIIFDSYFISGFLIPKKNIKNMIELDSTRDSFSSLANLAKPSFAKRHVVVYLLSVWRAGPEGPLAHTGPVGF